MQDQSSFKYIVVSILIGIAATVGGTIVINYFGIGTNQSGPQKETTPPYVEQGKEPEISSKISPSNELVKVETLQDTIPHDIQPKAEEKAEELKPAEPVDFFAISEASPDYKSCDCPQNFYPLPFIPGQAKLNPEFVKQYTNQPIPEFGDIVIFTSKKIPGTIKLQLNDNNSRTEYFTASKLCKSDINLCRRKNAISTFSKVQTGEYTLLVSDFDTKQVIKNIPVAVRAVNFTAIDLGKYLTE